MLVRSIETGQEYNLCIPDPLTGLDTLLAFVHNLDNFHYGHPQFFKVAETPYYEANQDTIDWWVGYLAVRAEAERADVAFCVRLDELPHDLGDHWATRYLLLRDLSCSNDLEGQAKGLLMAIRMVTAEMDQCDDFPPRAVPRATVVKRIRRKLARVGGLFVKAPKSASWQLGDYFVVNEGLISYRIADLGQFAWTLGVLGPEEFVLPLKGSSAMRPSDFSNFFL